MNTESILKQRLICVAVIDKSDDAVPLAGALLAGGLNVMEVTFRTSTAAESIKRIRQGLPGVMTPTEVDRALNLGWKHLKFFPAAAAGGVAMLKALAGPFAHTGVQFVPTGGINATNLPDYLALPQVAAIGGSWMAERKLVTEKAWSKITALTAEAMKIIAQTKL